jgi:AraC-like DNA-binding protein
VTHGSMASYKAPRVARSSDERASRHEVASVITDSAGATFAQAQCIHVHDEIVAAIQSLLSRPRLTAAGVAAHCGMSRRCLLRAIRDAGMKFRPLLAQLRIDAAKRLLDSSSLRVKEVATAVGYEHTSALTREFRRSVGQSPTAFRRQHSQMPSGAGPLSQRDRVLK